MEIVKGVHQIIVPLGVSPLGSVNVYAIESGDDRNMIIDTGWDLPESFTGLVEGLRSRGLGFQGLRDIVVTHVHADHYGLAGKIKQLSDAKIAMHETEASLIEDRYVNPQSLLQQSGRLLSRHGVPQEDLRDLQQASMPARRFVVVAYPDDRLKGGETFSVGPFELEVLVTPGHAPGHICLYEKNKKLLFCGDTVLLEITPNISYHPQSGENPLADFYRSLERLAGLEVNFVFPGHGPIFSGLKQRIGEIIFHHEQRQTGIIKEIRDELKTAYQIASGLKWMNSEVSFKQLNHLHQRLAVAETIAHLQYLVGEGKARRVAEGDTFKYWAGG